MSAKTIAKSDKIQKLKNEMKGYQESLNTHILVDLRIKLENLNSDQKENFQRLDESLQAIAKTSPNWQRDQSFESLRTLLSADIHLSMDQIIRQQEMERSEQRVLESLKFPDLIHGQKRIVDAHEKTYQWIFDASGQKLGKWSNFVEWLQDGNGTYWINGKPGSGKSTLMNFLEQNERTKDYLRTWAGTKTLLMPIYFFSVTGTKLQQSVEGLLRSLICQILENCKKHLSSLSHRLYTALADAQACPVWTEGKLRQHFSRLVDSITPAVRTCIFIDGLDECSGDHRKLLELMAQIANKQDVKVCFSSRPERPFEEFVPSCSLRLQDLTEEDMQIYVKSRIEEIPQMQSLSSDRMRWKDKVQQEIAERAQGVFLWVELVTNSQISGIRNGDDLANLERKLSCLPGGVEELYSSIVAKMERDGDESEAAQYLKLAQVFTEHPRDVLNGEKSHVLNLAIAKFGVTESLRQSSGLNRRNVIARCIEVSERIPITCRGFLELYDNDQTFCKNDGWLAWEPLEIRENSLSVNWCGKSVRFLHRSASDFFRTGAKGEIFLKRHAQYPETMELLGSSLRLVRMRLCNLAEHRAIEDYMFFHVSHLMEKARYVNRSSGSHISQSLDLLEYFDRFANKLYRDDPRFADTHHWTQRWLLPFLKRSKGVYVSGFWQAKAAFPCTYARKDLRSAAAFWDVDWYLQSNLETQPMDATRATQLAICKIFSCFFDLPKDIWYLQWGILQWRTSGLAAIEILMSLVHRGADPNSEILTSIWEEVLRFLYVARLEAWEIPDECIDNAVRFFSEAGAYFDQPIFLKLDPINSLQWSFPTSVEIDTYSLPIVQGRQEGHMDSNANAETSDFKPFPPLKRPLRLVVGSYASKKEQASAIDITSNDGIDGDGGEKDEKEGVQLREVESTSKIKDNRKSTGDPTFHKLDVTMNPMHSNYHELTTKVMAENDAEELQEILREIFDAPNKPERLCVKWAKMYWPLANWTHAMHRDRFPEYYEVDKWNLWLYGFRFTDEEDIEDSDYDD